MDRKRLIDLLYQINGLMFWTDDVTPDEKAQLIAEGLVTTDGGEAVFLSEKGVDELMTPDENSLFH